MRRFASILMLLLIFVVSACAGAEVKTTSSALAPDFTLPDQDGKLWKLSEALQDHSAVVLAFYPKDDTKD